MQKFEIVLNLEHIAQMRKAWNEAAREFGERVDLAMKRLIHEAAAQRMSVTEVAKASAFTSAQIKSRMKAMDLNPTTGKILLSKQAAAVLESNAALLGIEPHEIDLMSPLAYLPAGKRLVADPVSSVTEFPETATPVLEGYWCTDCEFVEEDDPRIDNGCKECGCPPDKHIRVSVVAQADEVGA